MQLENVTALVTGCASGLGAATVSALSAAGARVVGVDLADALRTAQAIGDSVYVEADVTSADDVRRAVAVATSDRAPLRAVVNCAGVVASARIVGRSGPHDLDLFARVVNVNLIGTFTVLTLAAAAMAATEPDANGQRGVIVNTASISAFEGQIGQTAYAASKGGVASLTLAAARDLAEHGIRVCSIAPGAIETPMLAKVDQRFRDHLAASVPFPPRLGRAEEFAELARMLIAHDYMNGETVRMDGGLRMTPR